MAGGCGARGFDLVLAVARVLHANGESTEATLGAVERLGSDLGLRTTIVPRWGELQIEAVNGAASVASIVPASATGVDMDRVASAARVIDRVTDGRLAPAAAWDAIHAIAKAPPAPTWLFTLAAAAGAASLSVLYGVEHLPAVAIIVASAALGALVRRALARYAGNPLLQPLCAASIAGLIGAMAVRYELSSSLRLIAVCPCMILVPGPHVLNGMMDLAHMRIPLGAARLTYATLVVLAISVGLLLALGGFGVSLPLDPAGRSIPLWLDTIAAGVAVAAFSVFFSMPLKMLPWPVAVGALAHALRWWAMTVLGAGPATGALVACLFAGVALAPIARRHRMPFAAIGFASVVSMMPGAFLFRMASGLVQLGARSNITVELLGGTVANGVTALEITLAMSIGLIAPKIAFDHLTRS